MMRHYLFCLRHFNDIDNIIPAIYYLLKESEVRATILIYSLDYPYRDDPSLKFITTKFAERVRVEWIGDVADYPYWVTTHQRLRALNWRLRKLLRLPVLEPDIRSDSNSHTLNTKLIEKLKQWGDFETVVFDQNRTSVIAGLLEALRRAGAKRIISLPVSPWINFNVLRQVDFIDTSAESFLKKHDYSGFDEIGQVDGYYAESLSRFFAMLGKTSPFEGKTRLLGAIRYSKEWLNIRSSYIPKTHGLKDDGRPKVLILPSHPKNNSFWDEYQRTLQFLGQFDGFQFLLKPHTRYGESLKHLPDNIDLADDQDSSELIDWADMILYWSTSVALEGFQKNKVMVCLDYLNANTSLYSHLKAGYICNSRDDLFWILHHYPDLETYAGHQSTGSESLLKELINHQSMDSISSRYLAFITSEEIGSGQRQDEQ